MIVHIAKIGDSDDPYLVAGFVLGDWGNTDKGQWVLNHAIKKPVFHCYANVTTLGFDAVVSAEFSEEDKTFFLLKWGSY